jgi:hypothetical protein
VAVGVARAADDGPPAAALERRVAVGDDPVLRGTSPGRMKVEMSELGVQGSASRSAISSSLIVGVSGGL